MSGSSEVFHNPFPTGRWRGLVTDHFDGKRFHNLPEVAHGSPRDLFNWAMSRKAGKWERRTIEPGPKPPERVEGLRVTFVNHATCLVQVAGLNVLTDPLWAKFSGPVQFAGPKRFHAPGIRFEDLPPIDLVLLSHDHYDHLCETTTRRLAREHRPRYFAGLGNEALLRSYGIERVDELDWWDRVELDDDTAVTFVPAQHFSGRGLTDRDLTLWGGLVLNAGGHNIFFAGDTGMNRPMFEQIRERCGAPDLALLPIGAFRPEWFMQRIHVSPAQAVEVAQILDAKVSVPIHYGTFALADDGQDEPLAGMHAALDALGEHAPEFWPLEPGEGRDLPTSADASPRISVA